MNGKWLRIAGVALLAAGVVTAGTVIATLPDTLLMAGANDGYTINLDSENAPELAEGTGSITAVSNTGYGLVGIVYDGATSNEGNHVALNEGGSIRNSDQITAITDIQINYTGTLTLGFGRTAEVFVPVAGIPSGVPTEVVGTPLYFDISAGAGGAVIESITVTYSCDPSPVYADLDVTVRLPGYLEGGEAVTLKQGDSSASMSVTTEDILTYEANVKNVDPYSEFTVVVGEATSNPFRLDSLNGLRATKVLSSEIDYDGFVKGFEMTDYKGSVTYSQSAPDAIKVTSNESNGNFLTKDAELGNKYSVEAHIQGTVDALPVANNINAGLLAYYQDADNWLAFYAEWKVATETNRPNELASIQPAVSTNGVVSYPSPIWCDGISATPHDGLDLKIDVEISTAGVVATATALVGGQTKTGSATMSGTFAEGSKVGVYCFGDTVDFTSFSYEKLEITTDWQVLAPGSNPTTFKEDGGSLVVNNDGNWKAGFVGKPVTVGASYSISSHIAGTTTGNVESELMLGFLAYYTDPDNFIIAYVQYSPTDRPHEAREVQITGHIGGNDIGWCDIWTDGNGVHPADGFDLKVDVEIGGGNATVSATMTTGAGYVKTGSRTVENVENLPTHLGVYCQNETATYTGLVIE